MGFDVRDRHVAITGGSRGIGLAIARALAPLGPRLTLVARDPGRLQQARDALAAEFPDLVVRAVAADLADERALDALPARLADASGPVEALVNNAGVYVIGRIERAEPADWDRMWAVNVRAPMRLSRAVLPAMRAAGAGAVVNLASVAGKHGYVGNAGYSASKFALVGFTQALRAETEGQGILVTAICPGMVRTDMTEGIRAADPAVMLQPDDVASAVRWALQTGPTACPTEVVLWPQANVFR